MDRINRTVHQTMSVQVIGRWCRMRRVGLIAWRARTQPKRQVLRPRDAPMPRTSALLPVCTRPDFHPRRDRRGKE
jgi:hypothetical protein